MKILEHGLKPGDTLHQARCKHCNSLIEFQGAEARFVADQRDGDALVIKCPVCGEEIWGAA